jgi:DNA-binding MarR family transcriptional regulator
MVKRLTADRLVVTSPDPKDARASLVALTERGVRSAHAVREVWRRVERGLEGGPKETARLHNALRTLLDRLGGQPPVFSIRSSQRPLARSAARRAKRSTR